MGSVLLIPTVMDIISTSKDAGNFTAASLTAIDFSMKGLLYNPYGCGMTIISLYGIITALFSKRNRGIAAVILVILTVPAIWLILNGFLYPRTKILITLTPLIIWLCVDALEKEKSLSEIMLIYLACLVPVVFSDKWAPLMIADNILLAIFIMSGKVTRIPIIIRNAVLAAVVLFPLIVSVGVSRFGEEYLTSADSRQNAFSFDNNEIKIISEDLYRFDYLSESLVNSNFLPAGAVKKTAMYSSVSNSLYSEFFYDIAKNPISYRNRVILAPGSNVFFNYFMGIKYVVADAGELPQGYREISKKGNIVLAENKNVLPIYYGSYGSSRPAKINIKKQNAEDFFVKKFPENINSKKMQTLALKLTKPIEDKAVIISFRIDRNDNKRSVIVDINGMRNKLSPDSAPYPNENYVFTYVLSSDTRIDELDCRFSAGDYTLRDITVITAEVPSVEKEDIAEANISPEYKFDGHTVFTGSIDMEKDGYFVTTLPYKDGYKIKVDEKMKRILNLQVVRYVIVGAITTGVDYIIYAVLLKISAGYLLANTFAWIGAVVFAFFANRKVVFKSEGKKSEEFLKFVLTRLSTLVIENVSLFVLISCMGTGDMTAKIAVSFVTIVLNYCICRYGIFREVA